jgi:hypothetical protein
MIRLGQIQPPRTGITFRYNEARQWLADAERVIAAAPSCNLPIVQKFRSFVRNTPRTTEGEASAVMNLDPADLAGMDVFAQCAGAKETRLLVEAKDRGDAAREARQKTVTLGVLGAAAAVIAVLVLARSA